MLFITTLQNKAAPNIILQLFTCQLAKDFKLKQQAIYNGENMTKWILGGFFVMGIYIFADVSNAIANYQLEDQRLALEKSKLEYKKDTYNSSSEGLEAQKQKHIFDMEDLKSKQEQS